MREKERITNREYQKAYDVSRQTAARELSELAALNILLRHEKTGRDTYYTLLRKIMKNVNASQTTQTTNKHLINDSKESERGQKEVRGAIGRILNEQ